MTAPVVTPPGSWALRRRSLLAGLAALPAWPGLAAEATLRQPAGRPLLRISGRIAVHNDGNHAAFDLPMLEELGTSGFSTETPWYDGTVHFEGVLMTRLLQAVGAQGETVTAIALNDYSTDIPVSDFARFGVLLAIRRDGQPMRVSDKGPLFIVYPYSSNPQLKSRQYYARSAWSLARLIVK